MKIKIRNNIVEIKRPIRIKKAMDNSWYEFDWNLFNSLAEDKASFPLLKNFPCLNDRDQEAGFFESHYFLQDLYVANKIYENRPKKHVDVGSRIDGFVSHVASFREIEVFDLRPMSFSFKNIIFQQVDFTNPNSVPHDYCDSISCLHALEHFGLGRYGDKIDPNGHLKGFQQIAKMLQSGGTFYFSVPMGIQRIEFNAHRIFSMRYLLDWIKQGFSIVSFAYIDDAFVLHQDVKLDNNSIDSSFNCNHGCAIFELKKNDSAL